MNSDLLLETASVLIVLLVLVLPWFGPEPRPLAFGWCGVSVAGLPIISVVQWRRANRLLREFRANSHTT